MCEYLQQREGWPRARNMGVGTSSGSCKQRFTSTTDSERGRECVDSEYLRLATARAAITRVCESRRLQKELYETKGEETTGPIVFCLVYVRRNILWVST